MALRRALYRTGVLRAEHQQFEPVVLLQRVFHSVRKVGQIVHPIARRQKQLTGSVRVFSTASNPA